MKFKIDTVKLVALLDTVQKGVGNSKIMPITEYIHFVLKGKKLHVTATDLTNFITYTADGVEGKAGEVIIHASSIIKLANKTTKKEMEFTVKEDHVQVKGNGTYKVALLDETYPTFEFNKKKKAVEVNVEDLKRAFTVNEQSISKEMLTPVLSGYNVGSKVITTDGIKMCINKAELLKENMLVTQNMAHLVSALNDKTVKIQKDNAKILFTTDNITIFGNELEGIEDYPDITPLLDIEHDGNVIIDKKQLMSALDRLMIFSDPFENNGVTMIFKDKALEVSDLRRNSVETLEYIKVNSKPKVIVDISVNIQYLKDLLSVLYETEVNLFYGEGLPLKIEENNVTEILSTMELADEEEAE